MQKAKEKVSWRPFFRCTRWPRGIIRMGRGKRTGKRRERALATHLIESDSRDLTTDPRLKGEGDDALLCSLCFLILSQNPTIPGVGKRGKAEGGVWESRWQVNNISYCRSGGLAGSTDAGGLVAGDVRCQGQVRSHRFRGSCDRENWPITKTGARLLTD